MYCSNCGSRIPDGSRFCQNCGASPNQGNRFESRAAADELVNRVRYETERAIEKSEVKRLAEKAFLFGIMTICFIAFGAGAVAMGLAIYHGVKSNRLADELHVPREKKAKQGILLACVPLMLGVLAGIVVAILAICGVIG